MNASQNFFALTSGPALKRLIKSGRIAQLPMQVSLSKPETRPDQMRRSSVLGSCEATMKSTEWLSHEVNWWRLFSRAALVSDHVPTADL